MTRTNGPTAAVLAVALGLSACGTAATEPTDVLGATVTAPRTAPTTAPPDERVAVRVAMNLLNTFREHDFTQPADPANSIDVVDFLHHDAVFDSLVRLDASGRVVPAVAESWTVDDGTQRFRTGLGENAHDGTDRGDESTYRFRISPTATYHDGTPVRAEDFVRAVNRVADPDLAAPLGYLGSPIVGFDEVRAAATTGAVGDQPVAGVRAVDAQTLEVRATGATAPLLAALANVVFSPRSEVDAQGTVRTNGPFQVASASPTAVELRRLGPGGGTPTRPDLRVELLAPEDIPAAAAEGRIDLVDLFGVPTDGLALTPVVGPPTILSWLEVDRSDPVLADPRVRTALSLAIDRDSLTKRSMDVGDAPTSAFALLDGAVPDGCSACRYDPAEARRLLAAAGVAAPVLRLADLGGDGPALLAEAWRAIGADVTIVTGPEDPAPNVMATGWAPDIPVASTYLEAILAGVPGFSTGTDEVAERLVQQARDARDVGARNDALASLQRRLDETQWVIPVVQGGFVVGVSERLRPLGFAWDGLVDVATLAVHDPASPDRSPSRGAVPR